MKTKLVFVIVLLFGVSLMAQTDLGYIELNTENMDQLEIEITKLNSNGYRVVHIFPPNAVLVRASSLNQNAALYNENIINYLPPRKKQAIVNSL